MSDNKRIVFIVNPISGVTGKRMVLRLIETKLDKEKYDYDIISTKYQGHAIEIAREAADQGVDIVCAIGGDGTVNEVATALIHTKTALAIIPCGSGNGLARHLHIPVDALGAIELINEGNIQPMDYGIVNGHPFFCTCGVGFDAFISMKFAQAGKRGPLTYIENVLKNGLTYNPETYDVELIGVKYSSVDEVKAADGEKNVGDVEISHTYKAYLISAANASQYGNNVYIAPQASVRDGLMDVTILEPFGVLEAPIVSFQLLNGTIDKNSLIKTFRCKKVVIHRSKSGPIHYDGDPIETGNDVEAHIVPDGLLCVSPSSEGVKDMRENINGFFTEHFKDMYLRSENLIQENIQKTQRITQLNKEILQKLGGK